MQEDQEPYDTPNAQWGSHRRVLASVSGVPETGSSDSVVGFETTAPPSNHEFASWNSPSSDTSTLTCVASPGDTKGRNQYDLCQPSCAADSSITTPIGIPRDRHLPSHS